MRKMARPARPARAARPTTAKVPATAALFCKKPVLEELAVWIPPAREVPDAFGSVDEEIG